MSSPVTSSTSAMPVAVSATSTLRRSVGCMCLLISPAASNRSSRCDIPPDVISADCCSSPAVRR
jgi:hypothetical protein